MTKSLKKLSWEEAEPIYRAFHAGAPLQCRIDDARPGTFLLFSCDYSLPPAPKRKTVIPAAFWAMFPTAVRVDCSFGIWYGRRSVGSSIVNMEGVNGFVAGEDESEIVERPAEPANDGWIDWAGGECPLPGGTDVTIRCSDGLEFKGDAQIFRWRHFGIKDDIIAYRIVETSHD